MQIKAFFKSKFGDKHFIKEYWRLMLPSLGFGFFFALAPIIISALFTTLIPMFGKNINIIVDKINLTIQLSWYFGVAFPLSCSSVIGNYIRKGNVKDIQSMLRTVLYVSLTIVTIVFIIFQIIAQDVIIGLAQLNLHNLGVSLNTMSSYWRIVIVTLYFYSIAQIVLISTSPMRMIKSSMFAAIYATIFYIICVPIFLVIANKMALSQASILLGMATWFDIYIFIFMMYYILLTLRKRITFIKRSKTKIEDMKLPFELSNVKYDNFNDNRMLIRKIKWLKIEIWRTYNPLTIIFPFKTGFSANRHQLKEMISLGWAIYIDQIVWVIGDLFFQENSVHLSGIAGSGWAGYNVFIATATLLTAFIFSFSQGLIMLPQRFVSTELGQGNIKKAKQNGNYLISWGFVVSLMLMFFVFIVGTILSKTSYPATSQTIATITYSYNQVFLISTSLTLLFGVSVFFNNWYLIIQYLLISGGTKFIQIMNSLVTVIYSFAIMIPLIHAIDSGQTFLAHAYGPDFYNYYIFYSISKSYTIVKLILGYTVWKSGGGLNSINSIKINKGKKNTFISQSKINNIVINWPPKLVHI